ncbi:MAG: hypothetical protein QMB92_05220 [Thiopseudomonas sp.]
MADFKHVVGFFFVLRVAGLFWRDLADNRSYAKSPQVRPCRLCVAIHGDTSFAPLRLSALQLRAVVTLNTLVGEGVVARAVFGLGIFSVVGLVLFVWKWQQFAACSAQIARSNTNSSPPKKVAHCTIFKVLADGLW